MADGHRSKPTSWATVIVIVLGSIVLGFALPMHSAVLGVLGAVVFLTGLVMAFAFRIMEDYH
jgi:membrane-bound ClpP family serine protease